MVQNEHDEVNDCPAVPLLLDSEESRIWETESSALKKGFVRKVVFCLPAVFRKTEASSISRKGLTTENQRLTKMGKLLCSFRKLLQKKT